MLQGPCRPLERRLTGLSTPPRSAAVGSPAAVCDSISDDTSSVPGLVGVLSKGPDVGSSDLGPRGPKFKKPIFNRFWAPGDLPNRCALKFHATYTYFHNYWWHGMNI